MKEWVVLAVLSGTAHADPPSAVGLAAPASLGGGGETTQLTATVTAGTAPASTALAVTCDLSLIGDAATILRDDGGNGDGAAGDLVFGLVAITGDMIPFGARALPCVVVDGEGRTAAFAIDVTIVPVCGDGRVTDGETCDDFGTESDDGCDAACAAEPGWSCDEEPSACRARCGDGLVVGGEECDDDGHSSGDGCSVTCAREPGWACAGEPSACERVALCGDGVIDDGEDCDDLEPSGDDGCDGVCTVEEGFTCTGEPSVCVGPGGLTPHDDDGDGVHDDLDPCPDDPVDRCDDPAPPEDGGCCSTGGGTAEGSLLLGLLVLRKRRRQPRGRPLVTR